MKKRLLPTMVCASLVMAGCAGSTPTVNTNTTTAADKAATTTASDETVTGAAEDPEDQKVEITSDFVIDTDVTDGYTLADNVCTITKGGEYIISGALNGNIIIDVSDDEEVELMLDNVGIYSSSAAPIYIAGGKSVTITAKGSTYNEVIDTRAAATDDDTSSDSDSSSIEASTARAAIYSKTDLEIKGQGALVVSSTYNNGIQSKNDLSIKNVTMKVTAVNNAIKGNDSITIESGSLTVVSTGGDGLKTTNSDVSDKGNQRGIITISGGTVDIYANRDGISAAYDADITEGTVNIYTDSYSNYSDGTTVSSDFYVVVPSSVYSEDNDYYVYYYNEDGDETWVQAEYSTMVSGGRSSYYGLLVAQPSGYTSAQYYVFASGATPSATDYEACSSGDTINTSMNAYLISSIDGTSIDGDYTSLSSSSGKSTSTYSAKGIKAGDAINISGGTITVKSTDDGLHANDASLDSGETGSGNVNITGGSLTVSSGDDGIHADEAVTIDGGTVNVVTSYEGIEGDQIVINDGTVTVYATDDGMNASDGTTSGMGGSFSESATASITVNGGHIEVETASGDTDAIDSNGSYTQTGGFVLVKGGASAGSVCGSVDVNGTITVTGGTIIALGGVCETPEDSVNAYVSSGTSFAAGDYTLTDADGNTIAEFALDGTFTNGWLASESFAVDGTYTLSCDGSEVISWTQTEGTMGATSGGMSGGGMGGGGMGGHSRW